MRHPRIFYYVYDDNRPKGGEKHSYQHVDLLNASGFDAYALHTQKGFRLTWFDNETRVTDLESFWNLYEKDRDYLVVPEPIGGMTFVLPGRKVIFNKNLYIGYSALGLHRHTRYPLADPTVVAGFGVSEHNLAHLGFAFPGARLFRMYAHIDCNLFAFTPLSRKKRRIVCVAKAGEDVAPVYHTLFARSASRLNKIQDYEWVFLQGFSERDTARLLGESLVCVTLSTHEGLPRTALEAMASGCLLVAYGTGPLKECVPEEYRFEHDDFMGIVRRIEDIAAAFPEQIDRWNEVTERARNIAEGYTLARQKRHLVAAWEEILSNAVVAGTQSNE